MHKITSSGPFYVPKSDANPQKRSKGPCIEHKYAKFRDFYSKKWRIRGYIKAHEWSKAGEREREGERERVREREKDKCLQGR